MIRTIVVGAGITGLAAAHRLVELARERGQEPALRVLDAAPRAGGVIATEFREGFLLEAGPDSMIAERPWGVDLARRLGLEGELIGTREEHRRSFVVRRGRLVPVPEGFQLLAPSRFGPLAASPLFSPLGKLRMACDLLLPPRRVEDDESLGGFVLRRLGREALERMAQPMVAGIYGADPMRLSLQATLPRFREMESRHGSVIRGMWARQRAAGSGEGAASRGVSGARYGLFVSFRRGMQTLTDALVRSLPPGALELGTRVEGLEPLPGRGWRLHLGGRFVEAGQVIVALPGHSAAALLRHLAPGAAGLLESVPYASSATMCLAYRREEIPHPLDGFGFVVPRREGLALLGCTFCQVKFDGRAPEGTALLRAFLGDTSELEAAELEHRVREDLRRLLGVAAEPRFVSLRRHARSMPQYPVGHLERVEEIERLLEALPGLALAGNALRGIGIPDCIRSGEQAAERATANWEGEGSACR